MASLDKLLKNKKDSSQDKWLLKSINDHLKQVKEEVDVMIKEADNPQNVMNEELLALDDE